MKCRLCGYPEMYYYYSFGNDGEFVQYKCPKCSLVSLADMDVTDQQKYSSKRKKPNPKRSKRLRNDKKKSYNYIKRHIAGRGRFFDIGCSSGGLLVHAREDGWKVSGLELSERGVREARDIHGLDVKQGDFMEYIPPRGQKYDLVSMRHVLEHLEDPVAAMKKVNALLNPNGYAFLEFPNIESPELKFKRHMEKLGLKKTKKYRRGYKPGHLNEFCKKSFSYLAGKTGFQIISWQTYSSNPLINWFYNIFPLGNKVRTILQLKQ